MKTTDTAQKIVAADVQKTALVLSGGGARGAYEIGVWQALRELNIRIDMVFGTSVGAINGVMIVQDRFEEAVRLWWQLETSMVFDIPDDHLLTYVKEAIDGGAETTRLKKLLQQYVDEDAIRKSPVEFGLVTTEFPSMSLLRLTKQQIPQGKLADYILASAACFPAVKHHRIGRKNFVDGGYQDNLPVGMALENGATHVIAVNLDAPGIVRFEDLQHTKRLKLIESSWDLGNFLVFTEQNARRIMRLGYLDTMKSYDIYEGNYYTFVRGQFAKDAVAAADTVAKLFALPAETLYLKRVFDRDLKDAIANEQQQGRFMSRKTLVLKLAARSLAGKKRGPIGIKDSCRLLPAARFLQEEILAAKYLSNYLILSHQKDPLIL